MALSLDRWQQACDSLQVEAKEAQIAEPRERQCQTEENFGERNADEIVEKDEKII